MIGSRPPADSAVDVDGPDPLLDESLDQVVVPPGSKVRIATDLLVHLLRHGTRIHAEGLAPGTRELVHFFNKKRNGWKETQFTFLCYFYYLPWLEVKCDSDLIQ